MGAQHAASTDYIAGGTQSGQGSSSADSLHSSSVAHRAYVQASIGSLAAAASSSGFTLATTQRGTEVASRATDMRSPAGLPPSAVQSPGAADAPPPSHGHTPTPWTRPPPSDATMRIAPSPGMGTLLKGMARKMGKWEAQTASLLGDAPSPVDKIKAKHPGKQAQQQNAAPSRASALAHQIDARTEQSVSTAASRGSTPAPQRLSNRMGHLKSQMAKAAGGDRPEQYTGKTIRPANSGSAAPVPLLPLASVASQSHTQEGDDGNVDIWGSSSAYRGETPPSQRLAQLQDDDFDDSTAEGRKLEESYEEAYSMVASRRAQQANVQLHKPGSVSARPVPRAARELQASLSARHPEHAKQEHVFGRVNALFGRATDAPIPHRPETRGQRLNAEQDDSWKWISSPTAAQRSGATSNSAGQDVLQYDLSLQALNSAGKRNYVVPEARQSEVSARAAAAAKQAVTAAQEYSTGLRASASSSGFASAVRRAEARERNTNQRQQGLHAEQLDAFAAHLGQGQAGTSSSASLATTASVAGISDNAKSRRDAATIQRLHSGRSWRDSVQHEHPSQIPREPQPPVLSGSGKKRATYKQGVQVPVELVAMRAQRRYTEAKMQDVYRRLIKQAITSNRTPAVLTRPQEVSTMLHGALER